MRLFFYFFVINPCNVLRYSVTCIQRLGNKPKPTGETKMNNTLENALKNAFESLTKEEQEKIMIAYMKNPKQALDFLWEELQQTTAA